MNALRIQRRPQMGEACLQHAATAAFEAQYAPAYGVIIAALTEPMTTITVHRALRLRARATPLHA